MLLNQYCCLISNILQTSPSTSQDLVSGAEQVTKLLSETLTDDVTEVTKARPYIGKYIQLIEYCDITFIPSLYVVLKAERISNDRVDKEYVFPDENDSLTAYGGGHAQVMVPSGLLQNISKWLICK